MNIVLVNSIGLILIGLIVWWFIIKKHKTTKIKNNIIDIKVHDGIYDPSYIQATKGQIINLRFFREDETPCSEFVIFKKLNISIKLPIKKYQGVALNLEKPGEYEFTCQMGMYRGKIIVK